MEHGQAVCLHCADEGANGIRPAKGTVALADPQQTRAAATLQRPVVSQRLHVPPHWRRQSRLTARLPGLHGQGDHVPQGKIYWLIKLLVLHVYNVINV